jgi:hypothetical protein
MGCGHPGWGDASRCKPALPHPSRCAYSVQETMGMLHVRALVPFAILALCAAGCGNNDSHGATQKQEVAAAPASGSGSAAASGAVKKKEEYPDKDEYIPAEFKSGADRWRDTGVYVDGKFVGLLNWAELPLALKPVWLKVKASAPKRYGTSDTGWRWAKERRYRFRDLVEAYGIDLTKVKAIHVYGPKFSETIVVSGAELRSKAAENFMFRFGGMVTGKALPVVPKGFGNGRSPDKVASVMIYIDKVPPTLERNVGLVLDGEIQEGVPYFGTPLRGGVRVYMDDRLVAYIKRQDLPESPMKSAAGEPQWKFFDYLRSRGVNVDTVVEGWVVRQDKWQEKLPRAELDTIVFEASAQAKGHIMLGEKKMKAQAVILRSQPVAMGQVPQPDPEEL